MPIYRLRHALIDPEVIKVKGQGHALPVCMQGQKPRGEGQLRTFKTGGYSYLYTYISQQFLRSVGTFFVVAKFDI